MYFTIGKKQKKNLMLNYIIIKFYVILKMANRKVSLLKIHLPRALKNRIFYVSYFEIFIFSISHSKFV